MPRRKQPTPTLSSHQAATPKLCTWKPEGDHSHNYRTECLRITVHRHILHMPDEWLVSCPDIGMERHVLKERAIDRAKSEALEVVRAWLAKALNSLT